MAGLQLTPVVLIEFFGFGSLGAVLSAFSTASSVLALCGPLLAALIIDQTDSYRLGVAFALVMGVLGFIAVAPLRQKMLPARYDEASHHRQTETTPVNQGEPTTAN